MCVFAVLIQLVCGVFRWLYQNVLGPRFGKSIDFKEYGEWARKLRKLESDEIKKVSFCSRVGFGLSEVQL